MTCPRSRCSTYDLTSGATGSHLCCWLRPLVGSPIEDIVRLDSVSSRDMCELGGSTSERAGRLMRGCPRLTTASSRSCTTDATTCGRDRSGHNCRSGTRHGPHQAGHDRRRRRAKRPRQPDRSAGAVARLLMAGVRPPPATGRLSGKEVCTAIGRSHLRTPPSRDGRTYGDPHREPPTRAHLGDRSGISHPIGGKKARVRRGAAGRAIDGPGWAISHSGR